MKTNYEEKTWKEAYENDGFVIVRDLLDPERLSALRHGMDKITNNLHSLPQNLLKEIFLERDHVNNNPQWYTGNLTADECGENVRQIADIAVFDSVFAGLICYPPLLDVLEALFATTEFSFTQMVGRPKAARVGNGVRNGAFHRDTPDLGYTSADVIQVFICLDEMTAENGPTMLIRGSHKVSDEEASKPCWRDVELDGSMLEHKVLALCPVGSGLFFNSKIVHAAGHNRSGQARRTLNSEWAGPGVLTTSPVRFSYQGLKPRSNDPVFQKQTRMSLPGALASMSRVGR